MKILKTIKHKNGNETWTYTINEQEDKILRFLARAKHKKYCKKFINNCILKGINNMIKGVK